MSASHYNIKLYTLSIFKYHLFFIFELTSKETKLVYCKKLKIFECLFQLNEVYLFLTVNNLSMTSTFSKLSNASSKLSNRRIFPKPATQNQGNDLFRIAAKIR